MTTPVQRWTLVSHHSQAACTVSLLDHPEGPAVLVERPGSAARLLVGQLAARWIDATLCIGDPIGGGGDPERPARH